jgi:hypothetical protein
MNTQEEIIVRELEKNPDIRITDLESKTGLPIGQVCKIRYFWRREKKREAKRQNIRFNVSTAKFR